MRLPLPRTALILLVALGFGLAAAWLSTRYLHGRVADLEQRNRQQTTRVVVARIDLAAGTRIAHDKVAVREVPRDWVHSAAVTPEEFERVDGSTLAFDARGGEALMWSQFEAPRARTLAARLSAGRRAATVAVDEISSLSGMLTPGDFIDLIVTVRKDQHNFTFPLLQGVAVLATGGLIHAEDAAGRTRDFSTVTLDLDPEQAAQVVAARTVGKLTALLRAPGDRGVLPATRSDALAMLGLQPKAPAAPALRAGVPVIYGGAGNPSLQAAPAHGFGTVDFSAVAPAAEFALPDAYLGATPAAAIAAAD